MQKELAKTNFSLKSYALTKNLIPFQASYRRVGWDSTTTLLFFVFWY